MNGNNESFEATNRYLRMIIALLAIICVIIGGIIIIELKSLIVPFALALIISFILNPIINFFRDKHIPDGITILIVLLLTFLILVLVGQLVNLNIQSFIANFSQYESRLQVITKKITEILNIFNTQNPGADAKFNPATLSTIMQDISLRDIVTSILGSVSSLLSDTFLVLLYLLFLLIGKGKLVHKLDIAFDKKIAGRIKDVIFKVNKGMNRYILTKTMISLLTSILVLIVLWSFGVEFAFVWALLTFALNFIPNIGSIIATLFPIVFSIVQFNQIMIVVWIALSLLVIQTVVGNFLEPKIMGRSMNISPLVVLLSLMFWGFAWGIIGMILAVPIAVFGKTVMENISGLKPFSILMGDHQ